MLIKRNTKSSQQEAPHRMETVSGAVAHLESEGYRENYWIEDGGITKGRSDGVKPAAEFTVEREYRFEGTSNPSDMSIVIGLSRDGSDEKGILVANYGAGITAQEQEVLTTLAD